MKRSQLAGIQAGVSLSIWRRLRPMGAVLLALQLTILPLAAGPAPADRPVSAGASDVVLATMRTELKRAKVDLSKERSRAVFFELHGV